MKWSKSRRQRTIGGRIGRWAELEPLQPAFIASNFFDFSYRQLIDQINQMRTGLRQAGLHHGARIAVALPSGPEAALGVVAVACSAVAVPLDPEPDLP